ncbi:Gfo/Idh/MocA family protein [Nakamurella endophytica]|uniref:Oxidoreductase n=1 Tax=Nakamurella endophytica TaxID=1748367 RepID=A0A917SVD0_9ACTN|nr:Gfo/Idh/MocA family oxidoreductase [Nakamurella endophytica]GGL97867.1 oxidoreductase [Nakamurella endophytica]
MTAPLRAAVLGYGLAGSVFHAPLLTAEPDCTVAAIVTGNPDRAAAAGERYPRATVLGTVDELLARAGDYDLAVVAAPTPVHAELAERTLSAGLPTVVDKPLAVHSADVERLLTLAARLGVPLTAFQNRRWDGDFRTVRRLVDSGALGEVWRFESRFEWLNPRPRPAWKSGTAGADGGGVAYDLGAHLIDQAVQLFGPVDSYYGELLTHRAGAVNDDDSFVALRHVSGVRSHLSMSSLVAQRGFRFRVLGSEQAFTKWGLDPQESQLASGIAATDPAFGVEEPERWGRLGNDEDAATVPTEHGGYREFYRLFAAAVRGRGPLPVDPADALVGVRILEDLHATGG